MSTILPIRRRAHFEVEDANPEWERLVIRAGLNAELELHDKNFGQRYFIVADPNGAPIDLITPIPPSAAFAD